MTLAEQAGDTEALGAALIARQFTLRGPGFLTDRMSAGLAVLDIALASATRICCSARTSGWSPTVSRPARSLRWPPMSTRWPR